MKNPKKWDYINDFKMTADGKYTYMGDWYCVADKESYRKTYIFFSLIAFINTGLVIATGLINAAGMNNTFYVILPYVAQVCSVFSLLWKSIRLISSGKKIKAYVYETAVQGIPAALISLFIFSLVTLLSSVIFLILHGFEGKTALCVLFIILQILTALSAFLSKNFYKKQRWAKL